MLRYVLVAESTGVMCTLQAQKAGYGGNRSTSQLAYMYRGLETVQQYMVTPAAAVGAGGALEPPPEEAAAVAALKQQLASAEAKYKAGQFNVSMRELVAQYVALEEYYMEETASMAIRLDQMVSEGAPAADCVGQCEHMHFGHPVRCPSACQNACILSIAYSICSRLYQLHACLRLAHTRFLPNPLTPVSPHPPGCCCHDFLHGG